MPKNANFLEKNVKSPQCRGLRPWTPIDLRRLGATRRKASGGIHPGRRFWRCTNTLCSKI